MEREMGKLPPCNASSGPEWNYSTTPGFSSPSSFLRGERNDLCSLLCTANTWGFFNSILRMLLLCPRDTSHSDTPVHMCSVLHLSETHRGLWSMSVHLCILSVADSLNIRLKLLLKLCVTTSIPPFKLKSWAEINMNMLQNSKT